MTAPTNSPAMSPEHQRRGGEQDERQAQGQRMEAADHPEGVGLADQAVVEGQQVLGTCSPERARISDEAVDAALDVIMDDGHNGIECRPDRNLQVTVRAALEAALPYLLASECNCPTDADVTPDMRTETGQHLAGCPTLGGDA